MGAFFMINAILFYLTYVYVFHYKKRMAGFVRACRCFL